MSTLAVFLVLGGATALAGVIISSNSDVGPDTISGHNPPAGAHSNVIVESIDTTDLAPGAVATGRIAGGAVTEGKLDSGAVTASRLGNGSVTTGKFAPDATAPNSARLGGRAPSAYQRHIYSNCDALGAAISDIDAVGNAECIRQVFPIVADPVVNGFPAHKSFGQSKLVVETGCGASSAFVKFLNESSGAATLNWMFSQGGATSTVNASGTVIDPFPGAIDFVYANRLEGQWIYSGGGGVTTVQLHAFRGANSCEVRGTALWTPNT